jgi:hypothetical protein
LANFSWNLRKAVNETLAVFLVHFILTNEKQGKGEKLILVVKESWHAASGNYKTANVNTSYMLLKKLFGRLSGWVVGNF